MANVVDKVLEWPIYLTDNDEIYCDQSPCEEPHFLQEVSGRRHRFADIAQGLGEHIRKHHQA